MSGTYGIKYAMNDYQFGYHNGWLDRSCGLRLSFALNAPSAEYARGYRDGQAAHDQGGPCDHES